MPPASDGGTEVSLAGEEDRFVQNSFWQRTDLPNVEGVAGQMTVTGHGCVWCALRTQTGRVTLFLLYARSVPGLQFELTSGHAMAVAGLEVHRKADDRGVARGYVHHTASGETAQLTACQKLFCLSNVAVNPERFAANHQQRKAWVIEDATLAATAIKATVDSRQLETKMGFLAPNDSQKLCTEWGAKLSRRGHDAAAMNHIGRYMA